VTEGEPVIVAYEVTNTGDIQDTQDIEFTINGTTEAIETGVTLNGSETFSGQFRYQTLVGDIPAVTVAVSSTDDTTSESVTVNEPATFEVTLTSVNSSVTGGETITVDYEVTNTRDVQDTQDIEFTINGTTEGVETGVTLNGSETFSGQFSYQTVAGDTPAVTVAVSSTDDTASESVTVNEPANFEVTLTSVNSSVTGGESITVAYDVTNTGDIRDTQDIEFAVNGTTEGIETGVTLNGSETFSGQFSYQTVAGDTPAVTVAVSSTDDTASESVTVNEPATFEVTLTSVNSSVTGGETITVDYEVTNTRDVQDTQDIEFTINGTTEGIETGVTLNGSETVSGQFSYQTVAGDTPAVTVAVSSTDNTARESVAVNEPANFEVTLTSVDSSVTGGETITVAYNVTNTGDVQDTQDLEFTINGTTETIESGVTLNGSETFSGQFSYQTFVGDTPAVTVAVSSTDDTTSESVTVNEPATFDVTLTSVNSSVTEGEPITVNYEVTNTRDVQDTQDIEFTINGTIEAVETGVTLNGSETFSSQFSYQTLVGDTPAVTVAVSSTDDTARESVTVNELSDTTPPTITDVRAIDRTDRDGVVTSGDLVELRAFVTDNGSGVRRVAAFPEVFVAVEVVLA
jgi:predicted  nucleic acid-binding Zn-ribbon protein